MMTAPTTDTDWWKGAVIYQIYPRSFFDSNGDGLGDLGGIEAKLNYIVSLGVDAVWLSPIFPSPQADFGYDVADYCGIEPAYGSLDGFDQLVAATHARGLKIILDQVLSHTSNQHPWFIESRSSPDNPKADWYVWADPKADGTVPNNWLAAFGGPAWSYWPERKQYYHHKFYREQPKLNLHNPDVLAAVLESVRFWLERGVDGFRLDVANSYLHDPALSDNPSIAASARGPFEWGHPPRMQQHTQDANRPENVAVLEAIRKIIDSYNNRFVFGEISEEPDLIGDYVAPGRLQSVYAFNFLEDSSLSPSVFAEAYKTWAQWPHFSPCITFSNHDFLRPVSRYAPNASLEKADTGLAKLCLALLLCLRGTVLLYQGEELGLPEADVPLDKVQDPVGKIYFPIIRGRDGCRTPIPWKAGSRNAGFSYASPWLPVPEIHQDMAVDAQEWDPQSPLHFSRALIALRKANPALATGDIEILSTENDVLMFTRTTQSQKIACAFNLSRDGLELNWPFLGQTTLEPMPGNASLKGTTLSLSALSGFAVVL